jgi:type IV pilus assembly protein PilX
MIKSMNCKPIPRLLVRQSGVALITGLIFLVVLTMIGVTAARMATLEERMSGNMRDRAIAMQAAEMALRDAERDIQRLGTTAVVRSPAISGLSGFWPTCNQDGSNNTYDDGLCDRRGGVPSYTNTSISWPAFTFASTNYVALSLDMRNAPSVAYGAYTGAPTISLVSAQPRYIIEGFDKTPPGSSGKKFYYRISVRAQGINANTVVWLQELMTP